MTKEMVIEWHDLIEDPNDLPPISSKSSVWSEEVYVQMKSGNRFTASYRHTLATTVGDLIAEDWYTTDTINKLNKNDIVAWAYIPRYYNREQRIDDLLSKLPKCIVFHRIKETNKVNVLPKAHEFVILYKYKDGEGIVSIVGFYDEKMGWMTPTISSHQIINEKGLIGWIEPVIISDRLMHINDVIGWSPLFEVKEEVISSNKEEK